jgi:hypothetical protein
MRLILLATAAAMVLPSAAYAQAGPDATANATATAEVVEPLSVACGPMHFGKLAPLHTATTVGLNAQGVPLADPDNVVVPGTRDNAQPSNCTVHGETGLSFNVTLPITTNLTHGSDSMVLDTFTISTDTDANALNRLLEDVGGVGTNGFGVGATLHVGADQAPGLYTGTFNVSVQYN